MKIFLGLFLIFSIVLLNGCGQREKTVNENRTKIESTINENIDTSDKNLTETIIVDISRQSSFREINVTSPRMHSPEIKKLQERLVDLGFINIGEIDGYYGPKTAEEIYFIKATLGFVDYITFGLDEEQYAGTDLDERPGDYQVVNKELWNIIFDPEITVFLKNISFVRLFNNDQLVWEPENNPKVTEFNEISLPYIEPDWVPSWGLGVGRKVQKEYYYEIGTNKIFIIEIVEYGWEYVTTVLDFTFQNGQQIRQSIFLESHPALVVRFSLP